MSEITCPHCESKFNIDDVSYSNILKQVHNQEFDKLVNERINSAEKEHHSALTLHKKNAELELEKTINEKKLEFEKTINEKNNEIQLVKLNNKEDIRKVEDNVKELKSQKGISEIKLKS